VLILSDLADFIDSYRPHGSLTADATPPVWEWLSAHRRLLMRCGL